MCSCDNLFFTDMESYTILQKAKMNINLEILKCKPIFIFESMQKQNNLDFFEISIYLYMNDAR